MIKPYPITQIGSIVIFLIISLYNNYSKNNELEYAKSSMDHLISEISAGRMQVEIYNPATWFISSFPQDNYQNVLPKSCSSVGWAKCICIYYSPGRSDSGANDADSEGVCRQSDFVVQGTAPTFHLHALSNSVRIENPPVLLSINQNDKTIQESK